MRGAARLAAAAREQRGERVAVPDVVAGPVRQARAEDLELEREEVREEAGARGRRERAERAEQVRALGRGLVEEPQARERRQPERPELGGRRSARRVAFGLRLGTHAQDEADFFGICVHNPVACHAGERAPAVRHLSRGSARILASTAQDAYDERVEVGALPVAGQVSRGPSVRGNVFR